MSQSQATPAASTVEIDVRVNGESVLTTARTLDRLLADLGFAGRRVATARNGDFVAEPQRSATVLVAGDRIEVVAPRQGG